MRLGSDATEIATEDLRIAEKTANLVNFQLADTCGSASPEQ